MTGKPIENGYDVYFFFSQAKQHKIELSPSEEKNISNYQKNETLTSEIIQNTTNIAMKSI